MAAKYPGKGAGSRTVSQSRTMWVKKGEIVNGKKVEKGYLAQYGKPEKRVSARVKIVTDTASGKKAGEVYRYKAGRTVKPADKAKGGKAPGGGGGGGNGDGGGGGGGSNALSGFTEKITVSRSPKSPLVKTTIDRSRTSTRARLIAGRSRFKLVYDINTGKFVRKRVK